MPEDYKKIQMKNSAGINIFPKTMAEIVAYTPAEGAATTVAAELANLRTLIASSIHMNVQVAPETFDPTAPATKADLGTIYLVENDKSAAGTYIEYIAVKTSAAGVEPATYAWEQIGTTAVDLTGYATETFVTTAINNKVADLNLAQYATVDALNAVDKKADDNAAAIKAINDSAVMNSGITATLVGKITANETAIGTINDSDVMKSGITADKVAKYEGYDATINSKANATDVYTKGEAETMAEGKASAAITALDLPNTYAAKAATEQHIANGDIHVTTDDKARWDGKQDAIEDAANIVFKDADGYLVDVKGDKLTNIIYFEEVTA